MRVGWGVDAHRFGGEGPTLLAGVVVDPSRGVEGTSDADVLAHAVADAILGACALGDLGEHFPSGDPRWAGADSMGILTEVVAMATAAGHRVVSVDATVLAERVRVAPHRDRIRDALASTLGVDPSAVSVKATTTDGMGFLGRDEGIAATAVVVTTPA
ncbi:MAG: 2-C-methyl-D-erythritol 2,4-cyclodiphosphate synthase [Acidimicrobiia bacterium]|nr:2-C-methyl-D-erythritol 2,4-cyclodiphosphate synthase [Acidimicrobiia bacterium]